MLLLHGVGWCSQRGQPGLMEQCFMGSRCRRQSKEEPAREYCIQTGDSVTQLSHHTHTHTQIHAWRHTELEESN